MFLNDYSYQQIADYLNKNGYTTKKGLPFNKNSFSSILENAEKALDVEALIERAIENTTIKNICY